LFPSANIVEVRLNYLILAEATTPAADRANPVHIPGNPGEYPFARDFTVVVEKIHCLETMEDCFTVQAFPPLAAAVILIVCV